MKILYINYWSISDPLTEATVFPNLKIIRRYCTVIYLATVERFKKKMGEIPDGVIHIPFFSAAKLPWLFQKTFDFIFFSVKLFYQARREGIDLIICRGSMAAIFGIFIHRMIGLPFIVESFEPHADYMAEGNTWKKGGLKYRFQKWMEEQAMKRALYLFPVSQNYADFLVKTGIKPEKILVMPCCVDLEKFSFSQDSRMRVRNDLGVVDADFVGIYVGKFGDIYLKDEAFALFKQTALFFKDRFFLIILSPQNKEQIMESLRKEDIPLNKVHVEMADHDRVPEFLSAADFSFSLVRPSPSRKYCCPVKDGEYWANGLPILIPPGIGDDEKIIQETNAGVVLDLENHSTLPALAAIEKMASQGRSALAARISLVAYQYRNFEIIERGYKKAFTKLPQKE